MKSMSEEFCNQKKSWLSWSRVYLCPAKRASRQKLGSRIFVQLAKFGQRHQSHMTFLTSQPPIKCRPNPTPWHKLLRQYWFLCSVEHICTKLTPWGLCRFAQSWCSVDPLGGVCAKHTKKRWIMPMASQPRQLDPLHRRQQTPVPSPTTVYDPSFVQVNWWPRSASSTWSQHRMFTLHQFLSN